MIVSPGKWVSEEQLIALKGIKKGTRNGRKEGRNEGKNEMKNEITNEITTLIQKGKLPQDTLNQIHSLKM